MKNATNTKQFENKQPIQRNYKFKPIQTLKNKTNKYENTTN